MNKSLLVAGCFLVAGLLYVGVSWVIVLLAPGQPRQKEVLR